MEKIIIFLLSFLLICPSAYAEEVYMGEVVEDSSSGSNAIALPEELSPLSINISPDDPDNVLSVSYAVQPLAAEPRQAVYETGMISSTYLDYARGFLQYVGTRDYVFARTGQYTYTFAIGDFKNGFNSSEADVFTIFTGYGNQYYNYTASLSTSFSLNVGNGLVYSNIKPYPGLQTQSYDLIFVLALLTSCFLCTIVANISFHSIRRLFN